MSKYTLFFKVILSFLILLSCERKGKQVVWDDFTDSVVSAKRIKTVMSKNPIYIDIDNAKDIEATNFTNNFIKEAEYIPLKSEELIGNVDYILINDSRIFILDTYISKRVFVFNRKGEFISFAGKVGQGPGEYIMPESIFLDDGKNLLGVCDNNLFIYYYDFDGNFIKRIKRLPGSYCIGFKNIYFNVLGYGTYSKDLENNFQLIGFDSNGEIIGKGFKMYPIEKNTPHSMINLRYNNEELLFTPSLSDTTYVVKDDLLLEAKYIFRHSKHSSVWIDKYLKQDKKTSQELADLHDLKIVSSPITFTDNFISFPVLSRSNKSNNLLINQYWFDKNSKKLYKFINGGSNILSDKEYKNPIPFPLNSYKDKFVGYLPPEAFSFFRKIRKDLKLKFVNSDLNHMLDDKNIDQAVVLYRLRQIKKE